MTSSKKKNYFQINSLVKVFHMIEILVEKDEWELADLTKACDLPKTTVHRMLLTLESLGYVDRNIRNQRYSASMKFLELGGKVLMHQNIVDVAYPFMAELAEETRETVSLSILDGREMMVVSKIDSKYPLKQDTPLGSHFPFYCSGTGKAVLAFLDNEKRLSILADESFDQPTPNAAKSRDMLEADLEKVVARGYAVDDEEYALGIRCVGIPILNFDGKVVAGLSLSAPNTRLTKEAIPQTAQRVMETGRRISSKLGWRDDTEPSERSI